jgi:predicted GIY-YIG superfamily endonuclease
MPNKPTYTERVGSLLDGSPGKWILYLLYSRKLKRSYLGITTDLERRARQHRGEIRGGARATRAATDWELIVAIRGFTNRSVASRWEKLVKGRVRGVDNRREAMLLLLVGTCPISRTGRQEYTVPSALEQWE